MAGRLFTESTIEEDFKNRRRQAGEAVAALTTIGDLGEEGQRIFDRYGLSFAKIDRTAATFDREPNDKGVGISISVPFVGSRSTFKLVPPGETRYSYDGIEGTAFSGRWSLADKPDSDYLVFSKTFTKPSTDEVKAWARALVDAVEQTLAQIEPHVANENRQLMDLIGVGLNKRKQTLEAGEGLGDLGTGI